MKNIKQETTRVKIIRKKQHVLMREKEIVVRVLLPENEYNILVERARSNERVPGREASAILKGILNEPNISDPKNN